MEPTRRVCIAVEWQGGADHDAGSQQIANLLELIQRADPAGNVRAYVVSDTAAGEK